MARLQVKIDGEWIDLEPEAYKGRETKVITALLDKGQLVAINGRQVTDPSELTINLKVKAEVEHVKTSKKHKSKGVTQDEFGLDKYNEEEEMERRRAESAAWSLVGGERVDDLVEQHTAVKKKQVRGYIPLAEHVPTDEERALRKHPAAVCERCPLRGEVMVPSFGPDDPDYIFVGEAPGQEEVGYGKPFVGWSGRVLRSGLEQVGIDAERSWFTNAALCHPPDNKINEYSEALSCCLPRLAEEIEAHPSAPYVVAVGKSGAESCMSLIGQPRNVTITRERGSWKRPTAQARVQRDLFMTVHPAFVLRTPSLFSVFVNDLRRATQGPTDNPLQHAPKVIRPSTRAELAEELALIPDGAWVSFDIETEQTTYFDRPGRPASQVLMIAICYDIGSAIIVPSSYYRLRGDLPPDFECVLEDQEVTEMVSSMFDRVQLCAHNGKFDSLFLLQKPYRPRVDFDTMLAHYALVEIRGTHGLKQLATDRYGVDDYEEALIKRYLKSQNDNYGKIPYMPFSAYAAWDVAITLQLRADLQAELERQGLYEWPFKNVLMPASECLTQVENNGILLDVPYMEHWKTVMEGEQETYLRELREMSGYPELNPNSTRQLARIIYDDLGFKPYEGKFVPYRSTNKRAFELVGAGLSSHPFVKKLQQFRRVTKMLSSYVNNILDVVGVDGRVHCTYLIHGTETGRLSAREPALQTIPRGSDKYGSVIRGAFTVPPGHKLVMGDYSQAELRIWAAFTQEPFLIEVYESGRDLHSEAALKLFGEGYTKEQRIFCKFFNFAYAYGGNDKSFAGHFQLPIHEATAFVRQYEKAMPGARIWRNQVFRDARKKGYCETVTGRRRRFPLITPDSLDEVKKAAANMPTQGTASDLTLLSLVRLVREGYKVVITVHDSIGIECLEADAPQVAAHLEDVMRETGEQWVPGVKWKVEVEILDRWTIRPDEDDVVLDADAEVDELEDVDTEEVVT